MSSCFINEGYSLDCRNASTGGLRQLWILGASGNTITSYTTDVDGKVDAISGSGTWYSFELPKQSASLTETLGVNTTAQSITFQPELVINLPKLDQALRNVVFDLVSQNEVFVLVEDNNGRYWLVFLDNGGMVSASALQSGMAYTDLNGVSALTISGGEPASIREVKVATTIDAVFTAGGFTFQP